MPAPKIPGHDFDGLAEAVSLFYGDAEAIGTPVSPTNPLPVAVRPTAGETLLVDNPAGDTLDVSVPAGATIPVSTPAGEALATAPAALPAGTDRSGTIAVAGTAQQLAAANAARRALRGQNISAGDLWINETGGLAAIDAAGSYKIGAGEGFSVSTNQAISIVGATLGQKFTATEV